MIANTGSMGISGMTITYFNVLFESIKVTVTVLIFHKLPIIVVSAKNMFVVKLAKFT